MENQQEENAQVNEEERNRRIQEGQKFLHPFMNKGLTDKKIDSILNLMDKMEKAEQHQKELAGQKEAVSIITPHNYFDTESAVTTAGSPGARVLEEMAIIRDRVECLATRLHDELHTITFPAPPMDPEEKNALSQNFPPFFDNLRSEQERINRVLGEIENLISRIAL